MAKHIGMDREQVLFRKLNLMQDGVLRPVCKEPMEKKEGECRQGALLGKHRHRSSPARSKLRKTVKELTGKGK